MAAFAVDEEQRREELDRRGPEPFHGGGELPEVACADVERPPFAQRRQLLRTRDRTVQHRDHRTPVAGGCLQLGDLRAVLRQPIRLGRQQIADEHPLPQVAPAFRELAHGRRVHVVGRGGGERQAERRAADA
jgi:hypothetical protein